MVPTENINSPKILVMGVGGHGGAIVSNLAQSNSEGLTYACVDADKSILEQLSVKQKIMLKCEPLMTMRNSDPNFAPSVDSFHWTVSDAAVERDKIRHALHDTNLLFLVAADGGDIGTGATREIASIAQDMKILTIGIIFGSDQPPLDLFAPYSLDSQIKLKLPVDGLLTYDKPKTASIAVLLNNAEAKLQAEQDLYQWVFKCIHGIADQLIHPGLVNIDLTDIRCVMQVDGYTQMGFGSGTGEKRIDQALQGALSSISSCNKAKSLLVNITASDVSLTEFKLIGERVEEILHDDDSNVFVGMVVKPEAGDRLDITLIASGYVDGAQDAAIYNG